LAVVETISILFLEKMKKTKKKIDPNLKKIDEFIKSSEKNTDESTKALEVMQGIISSKLEKIGRISVEFTKEDSRTANLAIISFLDLAYNSKGSSLEALELLWRELGFDKSTFKSPIAARNAIAFYKSIDEESKLDPEKVSMTEISLANEYEHEHHVMAEIAAGKHEISYVLDLFLILDNMCASVKMTKNECPEVKDLAESTIAELKSLWNKLSKAANVEETWEPGDLTLRASHVASQIMNANRAIMMAAKETSKNVKKTDKMIKLTDMFSKHKKELLD